MKYLVALVILLTLEPAQASHGFTLMEDYDDKPAVQAASGPKPEEGYREIIVYLDLEPTSPEHLDKYLTTIGKEDKLHDLQKVGEHLMSLFMPRDGVESVWYYGKWADSRALHLLHFVYMLNPKLNFWLSYHYASALILFPDIAREKYGIKNPISHAYHVYDQWLCEVREKIEFQDLLEDNHDLVSEQVSNIPMVRFNVNLQPDDIWAHEYAHRTFYAILSLRMIDAKPEDERQLLKGLVKYNLENPHRPLETQAGGFRSFLEEYGFMLVAGAFVAPLVLLSQHGSESFHHE